MNRLLIRMLERVASRSRGSQQFVALYYAVFIGAGFALFFFPWPDRFPVSSHLAAFNFAVVIATIGSAIVFYAVVDAMEKLVAKYKLAVRAVKLDDFEWTVLYHALAGGHWIQRPLEEEGLRSVVEFLNTDRAGEKARQALFQASRTGRVRYLNSVRELADRIRSMQGYDAELGLN